MLFYFLPMFLRFTVLAKNKGFESQVCIFISFVTSIIFFVYEVIQIKTDGFDYFSEFWNLVDLLGYACFWVFFSGSFEKAPEVETYLKVMVILQMIVKVNFFLRIYDKFGLLVNLISTCFIDIIPFSTYLFIWIICFIMLYIQSGIIAPGRKGLKEGDFVGMFLYVWENSIGNINDPADESFTDKGFPVVLLIWLIWFTNQFIIVIILLNFLIAVISQSYENVMNSKTIKKYKDIAHLNKEAFMFYKTIGVSPGQNLISNNKVLLSLVVGDEQQETEEWTGFVKTMKIFVKKHLAINSERTSEQIQVISKKVDQKIDALENKLDAKMEVILETLRNMQE